MADDIPDITCRFRRPDVHIADEVRLALLDLTDIDVDDDGGITASDASNPREILGSLAPPRGRNTLFSDDEDAILRHWMTIAEREGSEVNGSQRAIFRQLAAINPRHSAESWRARWSRTDDVTPAEGVQPSHAVRRGGAQSAVIEPQSHLSSREPRPADLRSDHLPEETPEYESLFVSPEAPTPAATSPAAGHTSDGLTTPELLAFFQEGASPTAREPSVHPPHSNDLPPHQTVAHPPADEPLPDPCDPDIAGDPDPNKQDDFESEKGISRGALIKALGLHQEHDLACWLRQPWVLVAYQEYAAAYLDPVHKALQPLPPERRRLYYVGDGNSAWSMSEHVIRNAVGALQEGGRIPRDPAISGDHDARDQHTTRFVTQLVHGGIECGFWDRSAGLEHLCRIAYRVGTWLRYLHRPGRRRTVKGQRYEECRMGWVALLRDALVRRDRPGWHAPDASDEAGSQPTQHPQNRDTGPTTPGFMDQEGTTAGWMDDPGAVDPTPATLPDPASSAGARDGAKIPRASAWLTEEAKAVFDQEMTQILGRWGVSLEHESTCLQIPMAWRQRDPSDLSQNFTCEDCPSSSHEKRLGFGVHGHATDFARAAVWFDDRSWPRTREDLEAFNSNPHRRDLMDVADQAFTASHLCHHAYCIIRHHIVYEQHSVNLSRNRCANHARMLRKFGVPIPQHCTEHHPPCLLQHAALTDVEAFLIQFFVLHQTRPVPPPRLPILPPPLFSSFESQLPLSNTFNCKGGCAVNLDTAKLASGFSPSSGTRSRRYLTMSCSLCPRSQETYMYIKSFWSHVRSHHGHDDQERALAEVRRVGAEYEAHKKAIAEAKGLEWEGSSTAETLGMLVQLRRKSFDWNVFQTWKLDPRQPDSGDPAR